MDQKGSVTIPRKVPERDLGDCFYVTKGLDGCLFVLSATEWQRLQERMKAMPISKSVALQRFFFRVPEVERTSKEESCCRSSYEIMRALIRMSQ